MFTLEQLDQRSAEIFAREGALKVPDPDIRWLDRLEAYKKGHLYRQHARCLFDIRVQQAQQMGFQPFTAEQLVAMLMGSTPSRRVSHYIDRPYGWAYNHHIKTIYAGANAWSSPPVDFYGTRRRGKRAISDWRCRLGPMGWLKHLIPYGIVLRTNELKELRCFNAFDALAPLEAWDMRAARCDPVVVGTIWELPPDADGEYSQKGDQQHFFLARW